MLSCKIVQCCYVSKMIATVHCMQLCKPNDICIKMWYKDYVATIWFEPHWQMSMQELEVNLMFVSAYSFCTTTLQSFTSLLQ